MIRNLRLIKPASEDQSLSWASSVPCLVGKKGLSFQPGLNILFGPNGSGKSTVLSLLATYLAANQGGRSTVTSSWVHDLFGFHDKPLHWSVEHDGQPVVYNNPRQSVGLIGGGAGFDDDFFSRGVQDLFDQKGSSGQVTSRRIADVVRMIMEDGKSPPEPKKPRKTSVKTASRSFERAPPEQPPVPTFPTDIEWRIARSTTDERSSRQQQLVALEAMLAGSGEKGPRTILLDEPETGFGLPWQSGFWNNVLCSEQAAKFQIIVATHSPFAVNIPSAHYVETVPGYMEECRNLLMSHAVSVLSL